MVGRMTDFKQVFRGGKCFPQPITMIRVQINMLDLLSGTISDSPFSKKRGRRLVLSSLSQKADQLRSHPSSMLVPTDG